MRNSIPIAILCVGILSFAVASVFLYLDVLSPGKTTEINFITIARIVIPYAIAIMIIIGGIYTDRTETERLTKMKMRNEKSY